MAPRSIRTVAVVAPARRLEPETAARVVALAEKVAPRMTLRFHDQCFLSCGHFAGDDAARTDAFLDAANDPAVDAVWFARGGYGSGRLYERAFDALKPAARDKTYLGYSDVGAILGRLYAMGVGRCAHGPMPTDILRKGGEAAAARALTWLATGDPASVEASPRPAAPTLAFNATVLAHAIAAGWAPALNGHVLMVEEVGEHLYAFDRAMFSIMGAGTALAGLMLGRVSDVPENDTPFGLDAEAIAKDWCARAGAPYLGRADIGHDADNKIAPFGPPD